MRHKPFDTMLVHWLYEEYEDVNLWLDGVFLSLREESVDVCGYRGRCCELVTLGGSSLHKVHMRCMLFVLSAVSVIHVMHVAWPESFVEWLSSRNTAKNHMWTLKDAPVPASFNHRACLTTPG